MVTTLAFAEAKEQNSNDFLRLHIRADSDDVRAQEAKYAVRDAVVAYLTPLAARAKDKTEAISLIEENAEELENAANVALRNAGEEYRSSVSIRKETFPVRTYGEVSLQAGEYDAVIIELGKAEGQNWWCVVYPPLCFSGTSDVRYKSLILERIAAWKKIT